MSFQVLSRQNYLNRSIRKDRKPLFFFFSFSNYSNHFPVSADKIKVDTETRVEAATNIKILLQKSRLISR